MAKQENYWVIRAAIAKAAKEQNDEVLMALHKMHPEIFNQMVAQAKNAGAKLGEKPEPPTAA